MKEKESKFKLLEFPKEKEEEIPPYVEEQLNLIVEKVKSKNLKIFVAHYLFQEDNEGGEETVKGGTVMWNETGNPLELLGVTEIMKQVILGHMHDMHEKDNGEKE